jgi:hypothetical protein
LNANIQGYCIVPFKKPHNGQLTKDQKTFNYHLSKVFFLWFFNEFKFI